MRELAFSVRKDGLVKLFNPQQSAEQVLRSSGLTITYQGVMPNAEYEGDYRDQTAAMPSIGGNLTPRTIKGIARKVGISTVTVSRVMNGGKGVSVSAKSKRCCANQSRTRSVCKSLSS